MVGGDRFGRNGEEVGFKYDQIFSWIYATLRE